MCCVFFLEYRQKRTECSRSLVFYMVIGIGIVTTSLILTSIASRAIDTAAYVEGNIKCLDAYSCANETLVGDTNIYCYGYYACYNTNMSVANVAHCDGAYGCSDAEISGETQVRCQGKFACSDATVTDAGDIMYVYGVNGFYKGLLDDYGAEAMKCFGFFSCPYAEVYKTSNLYVGGLYGFAYSEIDSEDVEDLNVYFTGLHASYGASVYCRNGSTCEVVCGANYGCSDNTTIYCYEGSDCGYDCDDCATDSCPTVHDYSDDSTWRSMYPNAQGFEEFVVLNEEHKDRQRMYVMQQRNTFREEKGRLEGDELFVDWLRDYLRMANPYDDGTVE